MKSIPEVIEKIWAWISGKETQLTEAIETIKTLTAEKAGLDSKIVDLTGKNTQAATELQTAQARVKELEKDGATKDAQILELKGKQTTAEEQGAKKAQQLLAGQGVPASQLPEGAPAAAANTDGQVAALRAKIAASKDPKEKFELANKIRDLLSPPAATAKK